VQHRRRCRRLVLAATGMGSLMVPAHPRVLSKMLTPRRHRDPGYARTIAGEIYGGTMRAHPERAAQALHAHTRLGPQRGYYYQLAAGTGWSSLPLLRMIRQPTLVLAGDDDPLVPLVNGRVLAWRIPNAKLHVIEQGGHLFILERPDDIAELVAEFLQKAAVVSPGDCHAEAT
jgi:pimeloyl-ACP methyl ester carboxylesterase